MTIQRIRGTFTCDECLFHALDGYSRDVNGHPNASRRRTALHRAASRGYWQTIGVLLKHNADPTLRDLEGKSIADTAATGLAPAHELEIMVPRLRAVESGDRTWNPTIP